MQKIVECTHCKSLLTKNDKINMKFKRLPGNTHTHTFTCGFCFNEETTKKMCPSTCY